MAQNYEIFESQYSAQQIEDAITNGVPLINSTNKHWMRWNVSTQAWVDTGIIAEGQTTGASWGQITGTLSNQSDLNTALQGKYVKPSGGIPDSDIASASVWNGKQNALTFDSTPTSGSTNPVTSQGIKAYSDTMDGRRTRRNITSNLSNLSTAIAEQNLEKYGYSIGDYFVGASGYVYHLADMDTYYGGYNSYAVVNTHHCGIVVDTKSSSQYQSSGSVSSYSASTLHTFLSSTALNNIKSDITALFGSWQSHLLSHTELDNSVGGWGTTWTGLADTLICALSEVQVYGANVWSCDAYQTGTACKPLNLFMKYRHNEIIGNTWWWLRSLVSASGACIVASAGGAGNYDVTYSGRVVGLILFH